jgi:histone H3/H4
MADVLVVASKVKAYVAKSDGMRTSSTAFAALSELVEAALDEAVETAKADGRVTIKDSDIPDPDKIFTAETD